MYKKIVLFVGLLLLASANVFGQISDDQVLIEAKRYKEAGMSQTQIFQELTKKGVSMAQLQRIRAKYEGSDFNVSPVTTIKDNTQGIRSEMNDVTSVAKTIDNNPQENMPKPMRVFGYDFFSQSSLTFAPNMNMPTPANYILGPGDEIIIDVWGDSELNVNTVIAPDGYINVSGLGRIEVSGMSVEQATARIRDAFSNIYSDLDSSDPYTFLAVSVGNTRTIKVNVMGEVVRPGTFTLTSFATAFHALYSAGGPNDIGSLRNIQVFRNGRAVETIDLYDYLMDGNNMKDINLKDGDIVKVNPYGILAQIKGEVKRPMRYEMREDETLNDLIRFAGGFAGKAFKKNVSLDRKGDDGMESFTVNSSQYKHFNLKDGDIVEVGDILNEYSNSIEITGAVYRPGKYAIGSEVQTLKDLLKIAQGTTGDAYLYRALLYRENEDLTTTVESIDLVALMSNKVPDIKLKKNDRLYVPSVLNLEDSYTVYVGGQVRNPGEYSYADNLSVEDIILRAGGLTEAASTARVDVYRRIKDPSGITTSSSTSEVFNLSLKDGLMTKDVKEFTLKPYDQVVVRKSPSYEVQENIYVQGEVLFAGQYAKKSKDERLSSIIERAGGLKDNAYIKGAKLMRRLTEEEKARALQAIEASTKVEKDSTMLETGPNFSTQYVGINLEKALENPGGDDDLILQAGDVLTIPTYSGTVKISGGVLYPNTVTYKKGMSLYGYVKQAGGYSRLAMKNKPYVVYMNGKVSAGRWAKIEPGCEIIVPEKPDREPMSVQSILGMTTSVATLAMVLLNIFK